MSQYRVFGCITYPHAPEAERRKLCKEATKVRFLDIVTVRKVTDFLIRRRGRRRSGIVSPSMILIWGIRSRLPRWNQKTKNKLMLSRKMVVAKDCCIPKELPKVRQQLVVAFMSMLIVLMRSRVYFRRLQITNTLNRADQQRQIQSIRH